MNNKTLIIGMNLGDFGSTGAIMKNTLQYAHDNGNYDYCIIIPSGTPNDYTYTYRSKRNLLERAIDRFIFHTRKSVEGFKYHSYSKRIIKIIKTKSKNYNKCIIHMHNIHHCDIDIRTLFKFFKKIKCHAVYTMHDTWAFTGGCYHFGISKCDKWKNGCVGFCAQKFGNKNFNSNKIWNEKKKNFELIKKQLILVPVSHWLENEIKQSFLKDFSINMVHGECSMSELHGNKLDVINKLNLNDKKIILFVSAFWSGWDGIDYKGTDYIYKIAELLPNDYKLIVIGKSFDTKGFNNIICIPFVKNDELCAYYSISDCFVSVSQVDTLPLVIMEAQICGVPVVGFSHGGIPEEIIEGKTGYMVGTDNNVKKLVDKIIYVCEKRPFKKTDIINNGMRFAKYEHAKKMLEIYNKFGK